MNLRTDVIRLAGLPVGQTVFSDALRLGSNTVNRPVTLGVERLESPAVSESQPSPNQPSLELPNVALTVYYVPLQTGERGFRIAATNISRIDVRGLLVRFWIVEA